MGRASAEAGDTGGEVLEAVGNTMIFLPLRQRPILTYVTRHIVGATSPPTPSTRGVQVPK